MKFIAEDQPPAEEGQRVSHSELVQHRLVAVDPALDGCHVVLFWWGGNREATADDTLGRALVRHLLTTARVVER